MSQTSSSDEHFKLAVGISIEALKALLLVNAGAATALIALIDKGPKPSPYSSAIIWFGAGAFATVVAFVFGYFSQLSYANHKFQLEKDNSKLAKNAHCLHQLYQGIAILFVCLSIGFGLCAMVQAMLAANI